MNYFDEIISITKAKVDFDKIINKVSKLNRVIAFSKKKRPITVMTSIDFYMSMKERVKKLSLKYFPKNKLKSKPTWPF